MSHERHTRFEQEEDQLPVRRIALVLAAVLVLTGLLVLVSALLLASFTRSARSARGEPGGRATLAPLSPSPRADRALLDRRTPGRAQLDRERAILGSYGWVDREAGVIRIPIERAMDLLAAGEARP